MADNSQAKDVEKRKDGAESDATISIGTKVLAFYKHEKIYYPAVVRTLVGEKEAEVQYLGFPGTVQLHTDSLVPIEKCAEFAKDEYKRFGSLSVGSKVYARYAEEEQLWYHARITATNAGSYNVRFSGFDHDGTDHKCKQTEAFSERFLKRIMRKGSARGGGKKGDSKGKDKAGTIPRRPIPNLPEKSDPKFTLEQILSSKKEGSANFYLSISEDTKVCDMMSPILALYQCGVPARYGGEGGYPSGEIAAILRATTDDVDLQIPDKIKTAIAACFAKDESSPNEFAFEYIWCASQISDILKPKDGGSVNLVHHAWVYKDIQPGQRRQCQMPMGVFNMGDENKWAGRLEVKNPASKGGRDASHDKCTPQRVSVHAAKRNKWVMCCSPNNAKIYFDLKNPLIAFWSAAIDRDAEKPRILVQFNWMFTQRITASTYSLLQKASTLKELLDGMKSQKADIEKEIGGSAPIDELLNTFSYKS
mmetsp:Transcript_10211/g.16531  ORF Transcript_10211/g.16531 Transcript_10211/m.16531 type:complete len:477 (+) Transcript_10211:20-1450(+)